LRPSTHRCVSGPCLTLPRTRTRTQAYTYTHTHTRFKYQVRVWGVAPHCHTHTSTHKYLGEAGPVVWMVPRDKGRGAFRHHGDCTGPPAFECMCGTCVRLLPALFDPSPGRGSRSWLPTPAVPCARNRQIGPRPARRPSAPAWLPAFVCLPPDLCCSPWPLLTHTLPAARPTETDQVEVQVAGLTGFS